MKRVVCIGQAPARPGSKHGQPGMYIRPWLQQIGLKETDIAQYFRFCALVAEFPGSGRNGHLRPTTEQILAHRPVLIRILQDFQPNLVLVVGGMAIAEILPPAPGALSEIIGNTYYINPFDCLSQNVCVIPLPHPSGRSTWLHQHGHLLDTALLKLQSELKLT